MDVGYVWLWVGGGASTLTNVPAVLLVVMEAGSLFTVSSHINHPPTLGGNYTGEIR